MFSTSYTKCRSPHSCYTFSAKKYAIVIDNIITLMNVVMLKCNIFKQKLQKKVYCMNIIFVKISFICIFIRTTPFNKEKRLIQAELIKCVKLIML